MSDLQQEAMAYMRSHVRINLRNDVRTLSDQEVMEMFATLEAPVVDFNTWRLRIGSSLPDGPAPDGPSEEDKMEANEAFIAQAVGSGQATLEVVEDPDDEEEDE